MNREAEFVSAGRGGRVLPRGCGKEVGKVEAGGEDRRRGESTAGRILGVAMEMVRDRA